MVQKTAYFLEHTQQRHRKTNPPTEPPTDAPMVTLAFLKR